MQPEYFYLLNLTLATALSMIIGFERGFQQKQAGVRTHTLVGLGAALFMVISKYGFFDLEHATGFSMDGSRVAAQVVSGVGFLGGGLIFVYRNNVRGLTTAASIWVVAAVGMAAGAGMYIVAPGTVLLYLIVTTVIRPLGQRMPTSKSAKRKLTIRYIDGRGILRDIISIISDNGLLVGDLRVISNEQSEGKKRFQVVRLELNGPTARVQELLAALDEVDGVEAVELSN